MLSQAHDDARLGHFKVLLIWSLDRLSREGIAATLEAVHGFERHRCQVWSLQESWTQDSKPETRELLMALYGWIAKSESARRSERTKAGLVRARSQGKRLGRPPGAKDTKRRKQSGYFRRWAGKREGEASAAL